MLRNRKLYYLEVKPINVELHNTERRQNDTARVGVTGTKGPPQYSRVLQEADASLTAPEGARRRRRRRMLMSLGSLSPRQSYPGYAVSRDLPRLSSRQPSPLSRPPTAAAATALPNGGGCLPGCLPACHGLQDVRRLQRG